MDSQSIVQIVLTVLHGKHGLDSLCIQNHIYGCFIVMEDIAESSVNMNGSIIQSDGYQFDIDKHFSEIGIRYGFIMDTNLEWKNSDNLYKQEWMKCFNYMNQHHDITMVETIEDAILTNIREIVPQEDAFLMNALENGSLSRRWQDKVITLLRDQKWNQLNVSTPEPEPKQEQRQEPRQEPKQEQAQDQDQESKPAESLLGHAKVEKPIQTVQKPLKEHKQKRGLHETRRHRKVDTKKKLATTHRAIRK